MRKQESSKKMGKTGTLEKGFLFLKFVIRKGGAVIQFSRGYCDNYYIYINNIFTMFNSFQKFIHVMVLVFRLAGSLWLVTGLYRTKLEPS